jgi:hypothetical protein
MQPQTSAKLRFNQAEKHDHKLGKCVSRAVTEAKEAEEALDKTPSQKRRAARKAGFLARKQLISYDAKIIACLDAAKSLRRKGREAPEGQALLDAAKTISATSAPASTRENTIKVWPKWKKQPGTYRVIHAFPFVDVARQYLVKRVLPHFLQVGSNQFGTKNGGTETAVVRVMAQIDNPRNKFVATCDVKNFYPSVDRTWLRNEMVRATYGAVGERVTTSVLLAEDHEGERSVVARTTYKPYENGNIRH